MGIVRKIAGRSRHYMRGVAFGWRAKMVRLFQHATIGASNKIYRRCRIETNGGGSIAIGRHNEIMDGVCLMTYGGSIVIGDRCSINPYTIIYGHGEGVRIGNDVLIAAHCVIVPTNHRFERKDLPISRQGMSSKGIIIEDDVWIGAGCNILDGVHIAKGSIVAAGSVVTKNVPENTIVAGAPARIIKKRHED